jgi:glutamate-5-semialdehyde dehydrogenase
MSEELQRHCADIGQRAKTASRTLAAALSKRKQDFLIAAADGLMRRMAEVLTANERDVNNATKQGLLESQIDRLRLTPERIKAAASSVRDIAALPEPIGRVLSSSLRPNGLRVDKVGVPLGVLFFLYESRPNVTVDAAALAVKAGNAIILRGGKEAVLSNSALHRVISEALIQSGLPADAVQLVDTTDHAAITHFLELSQYIDLTIPRGGPSLIEQVTRHATMPVMKHYKGVCHVYVDQSADLDVARRIVVNSKCQRPCVCNAAECLLVHAAVASEFLAALGPELVTRKVEVRGCSRTRTFLPQAKPATDADYATEYLDLILNVKVVESLADGMNHIRRFGSGHTEAIVTTDLSTAKRFTSEVDAAAVLVNASTRFHDGGEFGLGAEIGISTDKFHARGPCGLTELTAYKYVVYGDGQVRE